MSMKMTSEEKRLTVFAGEQAGHIGLLEGELDRVQTGWDAAKDAIDRVLAMHTAEAENGTGYCAEDGFLFPCRTFKALAPYLTRPVGGFSVSQSKGGSAENE